MSLQVLVNGFDITNGITHRINWVETTGLFDPVALVAPGAVDTFDGPFRVRQTTVDFGTREISISGILLVAASSYADKLRALDGLQAIYAARPSRVVVGTLELLVDFDRVQVAADQLKRLNGMIKYTVTGTAIPSTFSSSHGNGAGQIQGIPVDTQRVNEAAIIATMAIGVGTITNPGDVPTPAVLTIQGAASTVYYLATSATGRRVPIATDANGVGRLDERAGLYLVPGVNRITAYQAATGTATFTDITVMSFFGTTWRYSGNAASGNATRFDLGPTITTNRTGSARYFRGNTNPISGGTNGIVTAGDDEPRIGWVWQNRRNLIVNSLNLQSGSWTSTLASRTQGGALEPFGYSDNSLSVLTASDTGTGSIQNNQYAIGALSAISYVASVYILKDGNTTRQAGFTFNTTGGVAYAILNTSTGVAIRGTNSTGTLASVTVGVVDAGLWWRLYMTWTGEALNTISLAPAIAPIPGTGGSATATGSAVFACPQVEIGTTPTAYQATDASGISLDHPVNDSGLVLEGTATNLCLYSQDPTTANLYTISGTLTDGGTQLGPDGSSTSARRYTSAATGDNYITSPAISVSNALATNYTASVWLRSSSGTQTINIYAYGTSSNTTPHTATQCVVTSNWARFIVTWTAQPAVNLIKLQIGGGSTWNNSFAMDIFGLQIELGTAATSYIPTTTVSATRLADVAGLTSPHNLLLYSEPISQPTTIDILGTPWAATGWSVAASPVAGPVPSVLNAARVTTTSTATQNINQFFAITTGAAGGKVYTFSVWLRKNLTTDSVVLDIQNLSGTSRGNATATLTTNWQRFFVSVTMDATDTYVQVKIRGANLGGTIDVFGAQLTEGYLPGRYIRTTDANVLPVQMIDPSWSQNGYIEADFLWFPRSTGIGVFFGEGIASSGSVAVGGLRFQTDNGGPWVVFARFDSTGTQRTVLQTSSTVYNRGYARVRGEWTNYLLAGNRYMLLRIYVDGVLISETNFAGTAGSSWPLVDVTRFFRANTALGVVSNLVIGTPSLPEGSQAAGI